MKNSKGSTAALLTLGLVLVGSLVTLGLSYLTTTNQIASNPRAEIDAGYCCVKYKDGKNYGCPDKSAIQNVGKYCPNTEGYTTCGGYSSCDSLYVGGNIESSGTCVSYGAQELASQGIMCVGGGPIIPGTAPEGCKNTTCKAENFGLSSDPISYYDNKPDIFYFELNCGGNKHTDTEIQDAEYCGNTSGACNEIQCKQWKAQLKSLTGYDEGFMNDNSVWKKLGSEQLYTDYPCGDDLTTTYQTACMPPASATHTCDVEVQCADILGEKYTGKLYQFSDEQGPGENYYKTKSCLSVADPDEDCTKVTSPETPEPLSGFSCAGMKSYTIPGGKTCTCYFEELDGGAQKQTSFANFSSLCKNTCLGNPFLGDPGWGGGDNGYCCPKDCGG